MKTIDLISLSTRMFKARTSRTLLTIAGMGVGVGAVLFLTSLGFGLQKTILEKITNSQSLLTLNVFPSPDGKLKLDSDSLEIIKKIQGVEEIGTAQKIDAVGKIGEVSANVSVFEVNQSFLNMGGVPLVNGDQIEQQNYQEVILSSAMASALGQKPESLLEKTISLSFANEKGKTSDPVQLKIKGITPSDESSAYLLGKIKSSAEKIQYFQLKVKCSSSSLNSVRETLLAAGFSVSSISDVVQESKKVFGVIQIALAIFGIIALFVSAIGMFNTMTIALLERTEEIGIMKSVGASSKSIRSIFMAESVMMGFLGGLEGIFLGWIGGKIINLLINLVAIQFGGNPVDLFDTPGWFAVLIMVLAIIVGIITGLLPARSASRVDPLEALRYK